MNNLADFPEIADKMGELGVKKCVVSFYDPYKKVEKRTAHLALKGREPIRFMDPGPEKKLEVLRRMARLLAPLGITLGLCCESQLLLRIREIPDHTPAGKELKCIESNACIDGHYLKALYGGTPTLARDFGQRAQKGCQCTRSVDIGSYEDHPCFHDCLFCYANTGLDTRIKTELKK